MKIVQRSLYLAVFAVMAFGFPALSTTPPFTECPAIGVDTSCAILVVLNPGGTVSIYQDNTQGPYDGSDDSLVGVWNNSGATVPSVNLNSNNAAFGFDEDGICDFKPFTGSGYCSGAYYQTDPGDYAGPANTFTNISSNTNSGTVVFTGGLASGATTYFSLENVLTAAQLSGSTGGTVTPAPTSIILVMTGLAGAILFHTLRNRKNASAV